MLSAVASVGGHVIAWADDWEVSGATNPMSRPQLGPWLRNERGPYDGVAGAAVDRIGRSLVDCLNTGFRMRDEGKLLVTYGHIGPWDLSDPVDEDRFIMEAWGAQRELRATQGRNRDETTKARNQGRKRGKHAYGYRYVRLHPKAGIDHVALDRGEEMPPDVRERENACEIIRDVVRRILSDETGEITEYSEAARLTRLLPCGSRARHERQGAAGWSVGWCCAEEDARVGGGSRLPHAPGTPRHRRQGPPRTCGSRLVGPCNP
ncbi:recombinase family protein [Streptomyces sp. NPDC055157]